MHFIRPAVSFLAAFGASLAQAAEPTPQYFVKVVQNGQACTDAYKTLPMCASKNFVCRMKPGQEAFMKAPSCLAYDPSNMENNPYEAEKNSVNPWDVCSANAEKNRKPGDAPVCKRDFRCMCLHGNNKFCTCAPPDAVDDASGAVKCGSNGCNAGQYCHYVQSGGMQCGQKPYYS